MRDWMIFAGFVLLVAGCYLAHREPGDESFPVDTPKRDIDASLAEDAAVPFDPSCTKRTLRAGERFEPVDMVWVVDSSRSMADEQARIEQTMNTFVRDAESRNFDVRLVMVTNQNIVPAPLGTDAERYRFVAREVASSAPLVALLEELPGYLDFLRPDAALHFVVVSDDDSALTAIDFNRFMTQALGRPYVVHAVASPDVGGRPCRSEDAPDDCEANSRLTSQLCGAADVGREYYALARQSGGEEISICLGDWREVFGPLLEAVTPTEIPCSVELSVSTELEATRVEIQSADTVLRLAQVAGPSGCNAQPASYFYVDRPEGAQLTLCPNACAATMASGVELVIESHCDRPVTGPE